MEKKIFVFSGMIPPLYLEEKVQSIWDAALKDLVKAVTPCLKNCYRQIPVVLDDDTKEYFCFTTLPEMNFCEAVEYLRGHKAFDEAVGALSLLNEKYFRKFRAYLTECTDARLIRKVKRYTKNIFFKKI